MALPVQPPIDPMLAKLRPELPRGEEWAYEPKWDGFRAIVFRDGDELEMTSRDHRPMSRYFPELPDSLRARLPERCVVDGEIVIAREGGLDFDRLLLRIHPARSRIDLLATQTPASYIAFDLLALDQDLRAEPFATRRIALERALAIERAQSADEVLDSLTEPGTHILLTPQTTDYAEALEWPERLEPLGVDGAMAKRIDRAYAPGVRDMVKVKLHRTADCVVGGYRLSKDETGVGSLLLGLYDDDGGLQYVGHTSSFKAAERRALLEELKPLEGGSSFGAGRAPGGPSRWNRDKDTSWVSLEPTLVCEVSYDRMLGYRFRHAATFVRWRTDRSPESCTFEQVRS